MSAGEIPLAKRLRLAIEIAEAHGGRICLHDADARGILKLLEVVPVECLGSHTCRWVLGGRAS